MRLTSRFQAIFLLPIVFASALCAETLYAEIWRDEIDPFLKQHCLDCHSGTDAQAELDLTKLSGDLSDAERMRRWVLVHDRLKSSEMPPADQPNPPSKDVAQTLQTLSTALVDADRKRAEVVLRRLNRNEYENTIRDLFGVDVRLKQLLPQDTPTDGFDNVGEGLAVSAEAAGAYLRAADAALDAVFGPVKRPKYIKHATNLLDQKTFDGKPQLASQYGKMFRKTDDGIVIFQSGYCPTNLVNFARLRAPAGTYRGTLKVRSIQSEKPMTLRIYAGDTIVNRREKHLVGYWDVTREWTTIEFTDRLVESGGTFQPKCYGTADIRKGADTYDGPGIEIGDITIEGPLEEWPPPSRKKLFGTVDPAKANIDDAKKILAKLLPLAFRRPTATEEVQPYVDLVQSALNNKRSFESSLRLGIKAILCSPEFLFLDEPGREVVSQYALASRLSYFLWSSMPDRELLSLAFQKKLDSPDVLAVQVERMLRDAKSEAFTKNFVGQWLDLRDIDFTTPDVNLYPDFDELLKVSMLKETHRFFDEILTKNLSLTNFVDSDFVMINQRLAEHYGIDGITGQNIRMVKLPSGHVRGGVLTHASILKVTANGTTTSPVLRGAWVMENILGQTIPPPPSNVPAVEPDIRGATTLREQLAKHRNEQSCSVCHNKIDPAGFALENFDVIGGWRENYRTLGEGKRPENSRDPHTWAWIRYRVGLPVDASGKIPSGESFQDIRKFKQLLLADKESIARGIAEKLLTYGLGRQIGFSDRAAIDEIVRNSAKDNYGFRDLIHEIVRSKTYRSP